MTFVFVGLLILHGLRKIIGTAPFYICVGMLFIFTQLVSATEIKIVLKMDGADFFLAQSVLFLPYLAAILIIYVTEGTLAAQRFIIGAMIALGFYVYLAHVTAVQCAWRGFSISQGTSADSFKFLLENSNTTMTSSILAQTLDLFLIPIFFQRMRNMNCRLFVCVLGSLFLTQIVDGVVFNTICFWGSSQWWLQMKSSYIAKSVFTIWLSVIATLYLKKNETNAPGEGKGTLDILLAFIGNYGNFETLKQNLKEWEGRYRTVVENAGDLIILMDQEGKILDANPQAEKILDCGVDEHISGKNIFDFVLDDDKEKISFLDSTLNGSDATKNKKNHPFEIRSKGRNGTIVELQSIVNTASVEPDIMVILVARDVTEQNRLNKEKEELKEELAHSQRLESIGKLAGGVAHDFNNYLHAIQGNLDILLMMTEIKDEKILNRLEKISGITEHASSLTQQLLGFARKGKYRLETVAIPKVISDAASLFSSSALDSGNIRLICESRTKQCFVKGDPIQLQQIILNMLINAKDAFDGIANETNTIKLILAPASDYREIFDSGKKDQFLKAENFFCIEISDNGCGMDKEILTKIFEPFFTTKPAGKGTGMGLAMAYGTITNHYGWIDAKSEPRKGSTFHIFLPECKVSL
jgi:PAS domain S-box-containing protein